MAACTATLFDTKPGWTARVAERNAALLAQQPMRRRGVRTPEVIFTHHIDNTRLVKAPDPVRARQRLRRDIRCSRTVETTSSPPRPSSR